LLILVNINKQTKKDYYLMKLSYRELTMNGCIYFSNVNKDGYIL